LYEKYTRLKFAKDGPILTITLDHPPTNAIAGVLHEELSTIFREVNRDADVRAIIFTGAGDTFSAGGDINRMVERLEKHEYDGWPQVMAEASEIVYSLLDCRKPIVARINGMCLGLGASIALLCDVSVMVDGAKFGDPHVNIGLVAGDGGALLWPQNIGFARAREFLLTGDALDAATAAQIGLINHCVPRDQLDAKVNEIAGKLASRPAPAVAGTKHAINLVLRRQLEGLVEASLGIETWSWLSKEHHEAVFALRDRWARKRGG
jgi:enoyl-CoA hydratase